MREPLQRAAAAVRAGGSPAVELGEVAALPGCTALRVVAAAWRVAESNGAATAEVLDRLGAALDAEHEAMAAE
jgi:Flp pilus assembly protein TadB